MSTHILTYVTINFFEKLMRISKFFLNGVASLALLGFTLTGCLDNLPVIHEAQSHSSNQSSQVLMPLAVGNSWTGIETVNTVDDYTQAILTSTSERSITITDTYQSNGELWFQSTSDFVHIGNASYINRKDGLHRLSSAATSTSQSKLDGEFPSSPGRLFFSEEYATLTLYSRPEPVKLNLVRETVATDETITVPAGTYTCYHYRIYATPANPADSQFADLYGVEHEYYAPGIGPVKLERIKSSGDIERSWELTDVKLN